MQDCENYENAVEIMSARNKRATAHAPHFQRTCTLRRHVILLKVLGKSVGLGLCKTTKRKDQLYISLLVSVWRTICEKFNPNGLILGEI